MSSNAISKKALQEAVGRYAVAVNQTFELFRTYSKRPNDSTVDRIEISLSARQTKKRSDELLHDDHITLRGETQHRLIEISERLELLSFLLERYSKDEPLPQDIFLELRANVAKVRVK